MVQITRWHQHHKASFFAIHVWRFIPHVPLLNCYVLSSPEGHKQIECKAAAPMMLANQPSSRIIAFAILLHPVRPPAPVIASPSRPFALFGPLNSRIHHPQVCHCSKVGLASRAGVSRYHSPSTAQLPASPDASDIPHALADKLDILRHCVSRFAELHETFSRVFFCLDFD